MTNAILRDEQSVRVTKVLAAAMIWRRARIAVCGMSVTDPDYKKHFSYLSEAEDYLSRMTKELETNG